MQSAHGMDRKLDSAIIFLRVIRLFGTSVVGSQFNGWGLVFLPKQRGKDQSHSFFQSFSMAIKLFFKIFSNFKNN